MKAGGAVVAGCPRAAAFPCLFLGRHGRPTFRCYSSSSSDHASFIKDVAATQPPEHLPHLLKMLQVEKLELNLEWISSETVAGNLGETIISPGAKQGLIPLVIPLTKSYSGSVKALLRWPTAPPGMDMPVVEVRKYGVWLLSKNVDQYIHRILVEEDAKNSQESENELFHAAADAGENVYKKGDFAASKVSNLDVYLLKKVGLFPDIIERRVMNHFEKGDHVSAMVTGEFYTNKEHFPGFGRPYVFNAEILLKVGRKNEAKNAARGALKSPWWTLGCKYKEVADIAQWDDEQIEYIEDKVSEEGWQEDLKKGKEPAQIALDKAAFLLDLASVEGKWGDFLERIAECYKEAGLHDIAKFVLYRD